MNVNRIVGVLLLLQFAGIDPIRAGESIFANGMNNGSYSAWSQVASPQVPLAGELVINEYLANPTGTDADQEWFELLNVAGRELNLDGCTVDGSPPIAGSYPIGSAGFAVIARTLESVANGGVPADLVATFSLLNTSDTLTVGCFGIQVDTVSWTTSTEGISDSLDPAHATAAGNDDPLHWCLEVNSTYGSAGNFGTPGSVNFSCPD